MWVEEKEREDKMERKRPQRKRCVQPEFHFRLDDPGVSGLDGR